MNNPPDDSKWYTGYGFVALTGIVYIILLGLFTWIFNYSL